MISLNQIIFTESSRYSREDPSLKGSFKWQIRLKKYFDKTAPNGLKYCAHFADIPEFSLNPINKWDTPLGIYGHILDRKNYATFATERKYMFIFTTKEGSKILNTKEYTKEQLTKDVELLKQNYIINYKTKQNQEYFNDLLKYAYSSAYNLDLPISALWNFTRLLSEREAEIKKEKIYTSYGSKSIFDFDEPKLKLQSESYNTATWTNLLKNILGYDAIYDEGLSIIHRNEPYQILITNPNSIELVERIDKNKQLDRSESISGLLYQKSEKNFFNINSFLNGDYNYNNLYEDLHSNNGLAFKMILKYFEFKIDKLFYFLDNNFEDQEELVEHIKKDINSYLPTYYNQNVLEYDYDNIKRIQVFKKENIKALIEAIAEEGNIEKKETLRSIIEPIYLGLVYWSNLTNRFEPILDQKQIKQTAVQNKKQKTILQSNEPIKINYKINSFENLFKFIEEYKNLYMPSNLPIKINQPKYKNIKHALLNSFIPLNNKSKLNNFFDKASEWLMQSDIYDKIGKMDLLQIFYIQILSIVEKGIIKSSGKQ